MHWQTFKLFKIVTSILAPEKTKGSQCHSYFDGIMVDCRKLTHDMAIFNVFSVRRQVNRIANALANLAFSFRDHVSIQDSLTSPGGSPYPWVCKYFQSWWMITSLWCIKNVASREFVLNLIYYDHYDIVVQFNG